MPGKHTAREKRQARHIAESERARGIDPNRAESIGWATVNAQKGRRVKKNIPGMGLPAGGAYPAMGKSFQVHGPFASGKPGEHVYPTEKRARSAARKLDAHIPNPGTSEHAFHVKMYGSGAHVVKPVEAAKGLQIVSLDDYYDSVVKARAAEQPEGGDKARPKKFPRALSLTARMCPVPDDEAADQLRKKSKDDNRVNKSPGWLTAINALGAEYTKGFMTHKQDGTPIKKPSLYQHLRGLVGKPRTDITEIGDPVPKLPKMKLLTKPTKTNKALATGYTKIYGGGALKAPNRGYYKEIKSKEDKVEKMYPTLSASARPTTSSRESPKVLDGGSSAELSNSLRNVVNKSGGPMANTTDFNDLFKSELGASTEGVLCECPHCDAPITKSDLAKAHKGKGKVTHLSGPKHGKSGAHVSEQNPEGGVMRGGTGHGVHTSSRGVPGAEKVDEVHVQSTDRSKRKNAAKHQKNAPSKQIPRMEKAEHESSSDDSSSGDDASSAPPKMKKSITYRGTDHVMYVDDGSDAALAKAILEGSLGGTSPTQPLDLNNDLTRLLI